MGIEIQHGHFHLYNNRISYIIGLAGGKYPTHLYWGKHIHRLYDDTVQRFTGYTDENFSLNDFSLNALPLEFSHDGCGDFREGSLHLLHENGTHAFHFIYQSCTIEKDKPKLDGLPSARGTSSETLILTLTDELSLVSVQLLYTIYEDCDIIARSMRILNKGQEKITIEKAMSACVDLEIADNDLITLSGSWARERELVRRPLTMGDHGTSSICGASGLQTSPFMAVLDHNADEDHGNIGSIRTGASIAETIRV